MSNNSEIIEKVVDAYFNEPDKDLKEIFSKYTKDFSEDEKVIFYKNLKEIVN